MTSTVRTRRKSLFWLACSLSLCLDAKAEENLEFNALIDLSLADLVNVTITSQKRQENIQSVSATVTALDASSLDSWYVRDITHLQGLVPGLVMGRTGYDPRPAMRGVRTQQVEANDEVVSIYHDGIHRPRHAQAMMPYVDTQRVEVMHGPQGTLFGRNSFGGTIETITQKPVAGENSLSTTVLMGNYDQQTFQATANFSTDDSWAGRFTLHREKRDSLVENTFNDQAGLRDKDNSLMRVHLAKSFGERASILVSYQNWSEDSNGNGAYGYKALGIPLGNDPDTLANLTNPSLPLYGRIGRDDTCAAPCGRYGAGLDQRATAGFDTTFAIDPDPFKVHQDYQPSQHIDDSLLSAHMTYAFDFGELVLRVANNKFDDKRLEDADFSPYSSIIEGYDLHSDSDHIELQFTSKSSSVFEWVAGLYHLHEHLDYLFLWQDIIDLVDNAPDPNATPKNEWANWMSKLQMGTRSNALYGQGKYFFTDQLRVIVGARATYDDRHWELSAIDTTDLTQLNFNEVSTPNTEKTWRDTTWKTGIEFQADDETLLYGIISSGFNAGNFKNGNESYDQQNVIAYEAGSKSLLFDERLRLNLSAYYNDYDDLLVTGFEDIEGTDTTLGVVKNAGTIKAYGLESTIDWQASDRLLLGLRGDISRSKYDDFLLSNTFDEGGITIQGVDNIFDLSGEQVALSPDLSVSLLAQYSLPTQSLGEFKFSLINYFSDDYSTSDERYLFSKQDAYNQLDLYLDWFSPRKHWQAKLFVKNATDEEIMIRGIRFGGNVAVADYADPLIVGALIRYNISILQ